MPVTAGAEDEGDTVVRIADARLDDGGFDRSATLGTMEGATSDRTPARASNDLNRQEAALHREVLQLAALVMVAIAAFFVTRAIAGNSRDMTLRDAEAWYDRGEQLMAAGRLDDAIESLRRASVRNRY